MLFVLVVVLWLIPRLLIRTGGEPLPKSDAIVQLAFDPESAEQVLELYKSGLGRKIVSASSQFSPGEYVADYARLNLLASGVAPNDAEVQHLPLTDCFGVALPEIVGLVQRRGWNSVILVVHPEDSRAVNALVRSSFGASAIRAGVTYSQESRNELIDGWWRTHWKAQRVVGAAVSSTLDMCYSECR
jgi:hypothetical protein